MHVVTVNDYLARRDAEWMGKVYHFLGFTVSCIQNQRVSYLYDPEHITEISLSDREKKERGINEQKIDTTKTDHEDHEPSSDSELALSRIDVEMRNLREISRKEAYDADITYGTNNEFGFDYLRDNMVQEVDEKTQRGNHYAIIDEVDSILIDESRTPLIISAPAEESTDQYYRFAQLVTTLKVNEDYNVDEKMGAATLTEAGIKKMEKALGVENIYVESGISTVHHLEQALKAATLFMKDRDYVVKDGEILIVDEFTGRMMHGRRYSEGLHQAIEAKEGVEIKRESRTMATITFQNYFRMYKKLAGMTGTAETEAEEFASIYGLNVMVIPTNKPMKRLDMQDRIYKTEAGKFRAVIQEIRKRHEAGQPILVGTISIEKNELFADLLTQSGIPFQILNAKNHAKEAHIISQAGRIKALTVATNMAGRGVDIVLGGSNADPAEALRVKELGGLHVIGTERHESRRIDNQLRGRAGRQGDPGSTQFYVSTEDDLMRIFGSDRMKSVMNTLKIPDDMPIETKIISKSLESAQKRVEGYHFDVRKHLVEYDDVINKQREIIYKKRDEILRAWEREKGQIKKPNDEKVHAVPQEKKDEARLNDIMLETIEDEVRSVIDFHTGTENESAWNMVEVVETIKTIFPLQHDEAERIRDFRTHANGQSDSAVTREKLVAYIMELAEERYETLEKHISEISGNPNAMRSIEKSMLLRSIDNLWIEHLEAMQHLRTGIGLRGYGQRDPLVEYKKESYHLFAQLLSDIQKQSVYAIFKIGTATTIAPSALERAKQILTGAAKTMDESKRAFSKNGDSLGGVASMKTVVGSSQSHLFAPRSSDGNENKNAIKVGRNDPCTCGSGKKYKRCHGA